VIEGVEGRATKLIQNVAHLSYDDRMKRLGLTRLDRRRDRSDLVEIYKIITISGVYNVQSEIFFEFDQSGRRGHLEKLFLIRARLDVRKFVLVTEYFDNWNSLSENCLACSTVCREYNNSSQLLTDVIWRRV